jgi:hypothetical protein
MTKEIRICVTHTTSDHEKEFANEFTGETAAGMCK